jgi:hypothetical protein
MKKFSQFSQLKRIYEQDEVLANLPNIQAEAEVNTDTTEPEGDVNVVSFFSKLFESREMAHVYHLQVRGDEGSHAAHTALGDYYESVLDLIDSIIETYQGQYGIVDGYETIDTKDTKTKEKVAYFEELADYIKHARQCIVAEDTHLHNIVDEVVALIYRTLYKLKFTK